MALNFNLISNEVFIFAKTPMSKRMEKRVRCLEIKSFIFGPSKFQG